ncbi:MAG: succinate dehydrogenase assembly factor 2 [Sphingopyxis sp.]
MDNDIRKRRLSYRAWHRGTREADQIVGGYFDRYSGDWGEAELAWFEALIEEQDVDIMAWAFGRGAPPAHMHGPMMTLLQRLDYIVIPR